MSFKLIIYFIFFLPLFLFGELQYSHRGYFDLGTIHRLSDGSIIKIPYRIISYESNTSYHNINLFYSTALEFRLKNINRILDSELSLDLRELYLEWLLPIGDISLGKKIITWGSTSINSPIDIISPYNYYYLFSQGKEQKEGVLSINSNFYIKNTKVDFVLIPFHASHIIPLNDTEFPIGLPIKDPSTNEPLTINDEQIMNLNNPFEYGFLATFPFYNLDISTSYFSGYDRSFSFFGANLWTGGNSNPDAIKTDIVLSYRKSTMFGLGISTIINNWSIKGDLAYFKTDDSINNKSDSTLYRYWQTGINEFISDCEQYNETAAWNPIFQEIDCYSNTNPVAKFNNTQIIDNKADYYQYTLELEYTPTYDFSIISQLSISELINIGTADSIRTSRETIMFDPLDYFIPGIGLPNTFIAEKSISILLQKTYQKINLELRLSSIIDLDKKGAINEIGIEYEIFNNTKLLIALNKIWANNIERNPFSEMKKISHGRAEIKYYY